MGVKHLCHGLLRSVVAMTWAQFVKLLSFPMTSVGRDVSEWGDGGETPGAPARSTKTPRGSPSLLLIYRG
jgi:hypothetical protein